MGLKPWTTIEFLIFLDERLGKPPNHKKTMPQGTEVQVYDMADLMTLLSHDNQTLATGKS
jgi:hypothetical protein